MTTIELIKKVQKIASKFLEVKSVNFESDLNFENMSVCMSITVFFKEKGVGSNITVHEFSSDDKKCTINGLLKKLEAELEKFNDKAIHDLEI